MPAVAAVEDDEYDPEQFEIPAAESESQWGLFFCI
jgi:hypothetical protein